MALGNLYKIQQFIFTQFLSMLIAIIFLTVQHLQGYNIKYFLICSPVLLLFMILYYYSFWRTQGQQLRCFALVNLILLLCSGACFFGIYFGVFNKTLSYSLQKVSNCQIIGSMTTNISGGEKYSILYVNFEKDGENMLGYGCQSNLYNSDLFQRINPSDFYFYNSKIPCNNDSSNRLLSQYNINQSSELTDQVIENTKYNLYEQKRKLDQSNQDCVNYYNFSEVKLPSWMCMPSNISYEEMVQKKTCYISSYQNYSFGSKDKPYQNALERKPLQKVGSFIIVEFDDLAVPIKYFIPLIIFTFYPFIISTNLPMIFITQFLIDIYMKYRFLKPEQQIDQNLILQQKMQDKFETALQKQVSFQSPTTVPSRSQNEEKNNQTSQELKSIKVENSDSEIKRHIKSLSDNEIKQIRIKFQQQTQKISKNCDERLADENNKEDNNNQNEKMKIVDEEQIKIITQAQNEIKQIENQKQKVGSFKNKVNTFYQNNSDLNQIQIEHQ
ncbi:hypothetical protein ABPG74_005799 [Tetrahymena malaccensis]